MCVRARRRGAHVGRPQARVRRPALPTVLRVRRDLASSSAAAGLAQPELAEGGLCPRPELLFLDEPTAGLDPIGAAAFDELTKSLQRTLGLTVFLITHDLDTLYAICDRIAVLADKKVIAVGTIDELLALDHPWIQEYFNGPRGRAALAGKDDIGSEVAPRGAAAPSGGDDAAGDQPGTR